MGMEVDERRVDHGRRTWLASWRERHQHPVSFVLHLVGIPMAVAAVVLAGVQLGQWRWDLWWRPVGLLAGGYLLQWIGHRLEGNDLGEIVLLKKWLGRPFVAISPRYTAPFAAQGGEQRSERGELRGHGGET